MSQETSTKRGKRSQVLVLSRDPEERANVAEAIEALRPGEHRLERLSPDALRDANAWTDAAGAIALLGGPGRPDDFEDWVRLRSLGCAARVVVGLPRDHDPSTADLLIGTLEPRAVIDLPASPYALASALDRALPHHRRRSAREQQRSAGGLLGISRAIREVSDQIRQISPSRIPVLILGETGTGKEVVARAIHQQSPRKDAPFVALNCGALPESLLESELFGNERGAFTGADRTRPGVFEQADGGTLFLDEIGEMPAAMQVKMLRTLEDGTIRRLGGSASIATDVRIISATHRNLEEEVSEQRFRQDLFFRLNTAAIHLPPLRRRAVDIPFLAQHFAEEFGAENARDITLSESFIGALCDLDFPGNVRELRNAVERAIAIATPGDAIAAEHLPQRTTATRPETAVGTLKEQVARLEARVLRESLAKFEGNRTRMAAALGLSRAGLRQKLTRLEID